MIKTQAYMKLNKLANQIQSTSLEQIFNQTPNRFNNYSLSYEGLLFDFSKNYLTTDITNSLLELAQQSNLAKAINDMFSGVKINTTEDRAVLHSALRSEQASLILDERNIMVDIQQVLTQMKEFTNALHANKHKGFTGKAITDIVNIGIGGSDLGPQLLSEALKPYRQNNLNIHFISSIDGYAINNVLSDLNPETSLFVIASKTFTTQETMVNAHTAKQWFLSISGANDKDIAKHFVAVSTNINAVTNFGIAKENIFAFWDFVGGRYSICSSIGLSVMLYIGYANFKEFLLGCHSMDEHFRNTTDLAKNLPVMLALVGIWNNNFLNYHSLSISTYNTRLAKFPAYIQQLEMESNGKSVNLAGEQLSYASVPIIWGGSGINAQHAYYQMLHQGTHIVPLDIIVALSSEHSITKHNDILISNAIAQAEGFMLGKSREQAYAELTQAGYNHDKATLLSYHKAFAGGRPTNTLVLADISPKTLGLLIALYEHKAFVQGVIWQINSFDQMGVELGKVLAKTILNDIENNSISKHDDSTSNLIKLYFNSK